MSQRRTVVMTETGAPDVLSVVTEDLPSPQPGEVQLRQTAIGFNFIDVYQRQGLYPLPMPTGLGFEAAGIVASLGDRVADWKVGDRVVYMNAGVGAYADRRNVPAQKLVAIPDGVSDEAAATLLFKGLTAQYLLRKTHKVESGDLLLVHSATGGVGQILTRWATALGATVVGTTTSPKKRQAALDAGCVAVIETNDTAWPEAFLEATGGKKARVVYDAIGKEALLSSLDCAAPFGLVVSYGAASGKAPPIDVELLNKKGCLYLTRPSVFPHNADRDVFRANAADLFDAVARGQVAVEIGQRFRLDEIVEVHRAAEERRASGAIVIIP